MAIMRRICFLCGIDLEPTEVIDVQQHPEVETCMVSFTDEWGISLTDDQVAMLQVGTKHAEVTGQASQTYGPRNELDGLLFNIYPTVDEILVKIFEERGLPRLGGQSTGSGWSSFGLWQRCPYAWQKRYVEKASPAFFTEREGLAVGSIIHAHLALHYSAMMEDSPYVKFTPEECHRALLNEANPAFVNEGWRVFQAYRLYYMHEEIMPLAIEHDLKDPRTNESTRFDMIAYIPKATSGYLPGTYIVEHKSAKIFDRNTLEGWANDGEVIGEAALWERLGLSKRFGKLSGVIVNLIGKQPKTPQFHRTIVAPSPKLIASHFKDLKRWAGLMKLAQSMDTYPRSRRNCVDRYGQCDWWEHCATEVD